VVRINVFQMMSKYLSKYGGMPEDEGREVDPFLYYSF